MFPLFPIRSREGGRGSLQLVTSYQGKPTWPFRWALRVLSSAKHLYSCQESHKNLSCWSCGVGICSKKTILFTLDGSYNLAPLVPSHSLASLANCWIDETSPLPWHHHLKAHLKQSYLQQHGYNLCNMFSICKLAQIICLFAFDHELQFKINTSCPLLQL